MAFKTMKMIKWNSYEKNEDDFDDTNNYDKCLMKQMMIMIVMIQDSNMTLIFLSVSLPSCHLKD
jgi:hypothetical protein